MANKKEETELKKIIEGMSINIKLCFTIIACLFPFIIMTGLFFIMMISESIFDMLFYGFMAGIYGIGTLITFCVFIKPVIESSNKYECKYHCTFKDDSP